MIVEVKMFARAKDLAGTDKVRVELPENATVIQLRERLQVLVPGLSGLLSQAAFAVNNEFAQAATKLNDDDEIALLPPVSGGSD